VFGIGLEHDALVRSPDQHVRENFALRRQQRPVGELRAIQAVEVLRQQVVEEIPRVGAGNLDQGAVEAIGAGHRPPLGVLRSSPQGRGVC
jgi:hypothetical protein